MSLYEQLGGQPNMQEELNSIKSNPVSYLKAKGFNVPEQMNNAEQITRYLLQSGQIGNSRLQSVMRMFTHR